ncbi:poly-gamma-glutamate synthesis protein (capsule biosynthesis protein) [Salirhabdus euzebyi]|uniref:Poly-gamma-glutamate synthesis protein (Capsule biosynthesis protein) n=1 Tax=Salirhabdus euzebyi TaxID=394506 RepID=A0A841PVF1_9BACI|nr:CapA family protein [Salirhabdus euzebyi]MBB6452800.1 poly-gamma-glutamate synthesis protein (capsule biosynthesis protein) [Salirhabdus euzebyi]
MKKVSVIISLLLSLTVISVILVVLTNSETEEQTSFAVKDHTVKAADPQVTPKSFKSEITLGAVGDILIHNSVYEDARTANGYDFRPMLAPVKDSMVSPDIMFANQETILGGTELGLSSYPMFNSPYEVGDALKDAGVDIVSIANNHTLDRGEQAILNATDYLNKIGIPYVGGYRSFEDQNTPRIINSEGIKVGFVAYTYGTNGLIRPEDKPYLVQLIDDNKIVEDIEKLKPQVDFVVVSLHFGLEYQRLANEVQELLVDEVSKAGADIILGHHPHVLQPADWIEQENGHKTFVIYSLGNFLSGQAELYQRIGAVLHVNLSKEIDRENNVHYNISNAKIMPTYNYRPNYRNYKVVPLFEADQYGLTNAKQLYEEMQQHMKTYSDDLEVVPEL